MKKSEDFIEWYNEIVETAGLCDKRYPIKGMNVWTPYGWKVMRLIDEFIREEFDLTDHKEVCFPLLIPEDQFAKEKEHIKGFDEQVYWVTHAGSNLLDIKLCLRPTSETAIYPIFKLWVRSHADLPLKIYQLVNVFRYETKQTRAFMRVREIHFFESHTCHEDFDDAERQITQDLEIMEKLSRKLCLPYIASIRPDWDKFAGAFYTVGLDIIMPDGKTLQVGSIHQYKDNFSKPFDISYEDDKGDRKFVHQTTYGMSERIVGAVIGVHSDDSGLILPPAVAPYQIVIIPVFAKGNQENIKKKCKELHDTLVSAGFRVHLDLRELRPGNKYYDWELRGVPLRIELGNRDIDENVVTVVRRDNMKKSKIPNTDLVDKITETIREIETDLYKNTEDKMKKMIQKITSLDYSGDIDKVLQMYCCEKEDCGHKIETKFDASILGHPRLKGKEKGRCIVCGTETDRVISVAKTY